MPKVSVILPVYNTGQYLRQCLESILTQTLLDTEIICVDDGSVDDSVEILKKHALQDQRLRVVTQKNQGPSAARNVGLDLATGDYVLFLDSDDFFEPTMIEEMYVRCMAHDADIGICKIRYIYVDKGKSLDAPWSLRTDLLPDTLPFRRTDLVGNLFLAVTPCVWNKMFRRAFLVEEKLRFSIELRHAEDLPFTYMALIKAQRITTVDAALVNYRSGISTSLQSTVHERPVEICRALAVLKASALEQGLLDEIERDFVNAAMDQCLYTLEIVKTLKAFCELHEALKSTYLAELGIDGRTEDYFAEARYYERYLMLSTMSPEAYLFDWVGRLRIQRDDINERWGNLRATLDETQAKYEDILAENALVAGEVASLRSQLDEMRVLLFEQSRSLRSQLHNVRAELNRTTIAHGKASARLKEMRASRSYRLGRRITALPRKVRQLLRTSRKVK